MTPAMLTAAATILLFAIVVFAYVVHEAESLRSRQSAPNREEPHRLLDAESDQ